MTLSAMFLAIACILPFFTGQIPQFGAMLCPMHIPVLLCGFLCGWPWGMAAGFLAPLLRSVLFGMPPLFPTGLCMAFELASYGIISGFLYPRLPKNKSSVYLSLLAAMAGGRLIWGVSMFICIGLGGGSFGFAAFFAGAFTNALPGIAIQLLLLPPLVLVLEKADSDSAEFSAAHHPERRGTL